MFIRIHLKNINAHQRSQQNNTITTILDRFYKPILRNKLNNEGSYYIVHEYHSYNSLSIEMTRATATGYPSADGAVGLSID